MNDTLEPLAPAEAMQRYLDERRHELADATIQSHRYRLKQFVQWCEQDGIDNLTEFSGRDILLKSFSGCCTVFPSRRTGSILDPVDAHIHSRSKFGIFQCFLKSNLKIGVST